MWVHIYIELYQKDLNLTYFYSCYFPGLHNFLYSEVHDRASLNISFHKSPNLSKRLKTVFIVLDIYRRMCNYMLESNYGKIIQIK